MNIKNSNVDRMENLQTLKRCKEVVAECGTENNVVTYDLVISKKAKKNHCAEQPSFKNIFIQFGQFH